MKSNSEARVWSFRLLFFDIYWLRVPSWVVYTLKNTQELSSQGVFMQKEAWMRLIDVNGHLYSGFFYNFCNIVVSGQAFLEILVRCDNSSKCPFLLYFFLSPSHLTAFDMSCSRQNSVCFYVLVKLRFWLNRKSILTF